MSQKKKKRKEASGEAKPAATDGAGSTRSAATGARWRTSVVVGAFVFGVALGIGIGGALTAMRQQQRAPVSVSPSPSPPRSPMGGTDSYGRGPGDEHYGHDHP